MQPHVNKEMSDVWCNLFSVHDRSDADGERLLRHFGNVVAEEALVGLERVVSQRLNART